MVIINVTSVIPIVVAIIVVVMPDIVMSLVCRSMDSNADAARMWASSTVGFSFQKRLLS